MSFHIHECKDCGKVETCENRLCASMKFYQNQCTDCASREMLRQMYPQMGALWAALSPKERRRAQREYEWEMQYAPEPRRIEIHDSPRDYCRHYQFFCSDCGWRGEFRLSLSMLDSSEAYLAVKEQIEVLFEQHGGCRHLQEFRDKVDAPIFNRLFQ